MSHWLSLNSRTNGICTDLCKMILQHCFRMLMTFLYIFCSFLFASDFGSLDNYQQCTPSCANNSLSRMAFYHFPINVHAGSYCLAGNGIAAQKIEPMNERFDKKNIEKYWKMSARSFGLPNISDDKSYSWIIISINIWMYIYPVCSSLQVMYNQVQHICTVCPSSRFLHTVIIHLIIVNVML